MIDGVSRYLSTEFDYDFDDPAAIAAYIDTIKEEVKRLAAKVFFDNQLFRTTFAN